LGSSSNTALTMGNWLLASQSKVAESAEQRCMQKSVSYYMRANVPITTSGVFDQAALNCAIAELGIDNILFSVDDPFGDNFEGMDFLNKAQLSKVDKEKLAHENAERILKLAPAAKPRRNSSRSLFFFQAKAKAKIGRTILSFLVKQILTVQGRRAVRRGRSGLIRMILPTGSLSDFQIPAALHRPSTHTPVPAETHGHS
jgi:hypothetical protein